MEAVFALSDWAVAHVRHVEHLAGALFEALAPYHALGPEEERLLRAGALLHDVGYPTDPETHNKVSARIIRAHLGAPFTPEQVETIALLARYHRKSGPKLKHARYARLDPSARGTLCWLAGILRVADGLDRSHDGLVRAVMVGRAEGRLELTVEAIGDASENLAGGMRKRDVLERALGMPVTIRTSSVH